MRIKRAVAAGLVLAATMGTGVAMAASPELSTTDQLKARRYVTAGDRAYVMGFQDGKFHAQGWHVTGEMGGVWTEPLKLVDGVWFGIDGQWLGEATKFTSGWGYSRMEFPQASGLRVSRTDFAPDGSRAALFGLRLENRGAARTVDVMVDAHSEVMSHYPWAWTTPNSGDFNLADTGAFSGRCARVPRHRHPASERRRARLGRARRLEAGARRRRGRPRSLGLTGAADRPARPRASSGVTRARSGRAPADSSATG